MNANKNDIVEASKEIGLSDFQTESLWQALQKNQKTNPKSGFSTALLYLGTVIAFSSMTWFYTANLETGYSLLISIIYALIFFGCGSYFWFVKNLRIAGGLLSSLGVIMVPLIVYSVQSFMGWWPSPFSNTYAGFYRWLHGNWVPMEISTLAIASLVLYFIRFPFISVLIYFTVAFMSFDLIYLLTDFDAEQWRFYCSALIAIGIALNVLAFILYRKKRGDFGFWAYLLGMFWLWSGLTAWNIKTEWGYFTYFLIHLGFILTAKFFHRKIFLFFGSLGTICYISHLAYRFSDSLLFSYIMAAVGFSIILFAAFLMNAKKNRPVTL